MYLFVGGSDLSRSKLCRNKQLRKLRLQLLGKHMKLNLLMVQKIC